MTELLAPAGNLNCFFAALNAGADAVYLGYEKYSARAYAGNFSTEDLLLALKFSHVYKKKIYLTVNTLQKEDELSHLIDDIAPFYEAGLSGVIIQDLGVLKTLHEAFPNLECHASTQMAVTGYEAASLLKDYGVTRIVPARELSLQEIKEIKEKTGIEIECFIHGAMCYGYSGQCLFSSCLGQRSGNRGRCAGPCRLTYNLYEDNQLINNAKEQNILSMKDLCTIPILDRLICAGIDSFKIEGRMKSPEYVYYVTKMYRKYIDLYEKNPSNYKVDQRDLDWLNSNFSRGSVQSGYYKVHNGRELVTLSHSGYRGQLSNDLNYEAFDNKDDGKSTCEYTKPVLLPVTGYFYASADANMTLTLQYEDIYITAEKDACQIAKSAPATKESVEKQLMKTGNTFFTFKELTIELDGSLFIPNKILNELRREAFELLWNELTLFRLRQSENLQISTAKQNLQCEYSNYKNENTETKPAIKLQVEVSTIDQLKAALDQDTIDSLVINYDLFLVISENQTEFEKIKKVLYARKEKGLKNLLSLPPVTRKQTLAKIETLKKQINEIEFDKALIGNLDMLYFMKKNFDKIDLVSDSRLYTMQSKAIDFLGEYGINEHVISYELNKNEIKSLISLYNGKNHHFILPVYGHLPLMESAGCVLKTMNKCKSGSKGTAKQIYLTDRQNKKIPVRIHCDRCENTLYNPVPLSLFKEKSSIEKIAPDYIDLKFTIENYEDTARIISSYQALFSDDFSETDRNQANQFLAQREFTKGHFIKGVE